MSINIFFLKFSKLFFYEQILTRCHMPKNETIIIDMQIPTINRPEHLASVLLGSDSSALFSEFSAFWGMEVTPGPKCMATSKEVSAIGILSIVYYVHVGLSVIWPHGKKATQKKATVIKGY